MSHILVVIDMQNDFIDGALGSKEAIACVPNVIKLINRKKFDRVYATMDTHPKNYLETLEGKKLPVEHCIKHTEGWQLNPKIEKALNKREAIIVEKPTFGSEKLIRLLKKEEPSEITICGLCTDICVISNALLLRAAFPNIKINVVENACAGTAKKLHTQTLHVMSSCQIDIQ